MIRERVSHCHSSSVCVFAVLLTNKGVQSSIDCGSRIASHSSFVQSRLINRKELEESGFGKQQICSCNVHAQSQAIQSTGRSCNKRIARCGSALEAHGNHCSQPSLPHLTDKHNVHGCDTQSSAPSSRSYWSMSSRWWFMPIITQGGIMYEVVPATDLASRNHE
ncbi:hypothetical protein BCR44DRAFT_31813 [Catenaria anguillulae PL171]|uniref:Uncharacterized protein n=1 Tax=Catenaria anguillulae PL171 TaxID=765915 RepID=A0A1Y2HET9_9FUNG|nr:hypothetical protein BCR44DRAFT_31813 [Catenaria anguillulae PL171]